MKYDWANLGPREDSVAAATLSSEILAQIPALAPYSLPARRDAAIAEILATLEATESGITAPKLHIGLDSTQGGEASIYGLSVTKDVQNGGGSNLFAFAAETVAIDSTTDLSGAQHVSGLQAAAVVTCAGNYHEAWGAHIYALASLGGTMDLGIGTYTQMAQTSGIVTCGVGLETTVLRTGGTMATAIALAVSYHSTHLTQGLDAVATNQYGVRVGPIVNGTLNYAWYSEDGWVQIGDSVSIGTGIVPVTNARLFVSGAVPASAGFAQGLIVSPTVGSGATSGGWGIAMQVGTAAAAFTCASLAALTLGDAVKGAGSSITTQYGIKISDQTQGGTNYAIYTGAGPVRFGDVVQSAAGQESTDSGAAALGANCPAVTPTAPYTWIKMKTSDGSTVYYPVWK